MRLVYIFLLSVLFAASGSMIKAHAESPRIGHFEIKFGNYRPEVDTEEGLVGSPYHTIFANKANTMGLILIDRTVLEWYGTLSFGAVAGFWEVLGKSINEESGAMTSDTTVMRLIPLGLVRTFDFDWPVKKLGIPISMFARAGVVNILFKVYNSVGDVASYDNIKGEGSQLGYMACFGIRFLLDFIDQQSAVDFDNSFGVNNTYLFAEFISIKAPRLGDTGMVLSDDVVFFGLSFEF